MGGLTKPKFCGILFLPKNSWGRLRFAFATKLYLVKQKGVIMVNKSGYDYVLYFGNPTCTQCRALKESLKKANVVYEESDEYEKYNVMSFPTLILMGYKHGNEHKEVDRRVGFQTVEQLDDFLRHSSVERRVIE